MKNICEICELKFPLSGHLLAIKKSNPGLRLCGGSRYEKYQREFKFPLGRRCRKAMVSATTDHAIGEISKRWELLIRIYG